MDALIPEMTRRFDGSKLLGYLTFSDGRPDPKFRAALAEAFAFLLESNDAKPWETLLAWLTTRAAELEASGAAAFRDLSQAKAVLPEAWQELPRAYREHHRDLLAHQTDELLFSVYFLARCAETVLSLHTSGRPNSDALAILNDFVGYRPIAVLETRPQTEFYAHEKVAPIPLYFRGVGVAPGPYANLIRPALELLEQTDRALLEEASFDLKQMQELAVDPRAVDHFHPVNKRPSVLFGEWDPHQIDQRGCYTRFVLRQPTLDSLLKWTQRETGAARSGPAASERIFEAAAALCGTILMGAGVSGSGPTDHDSNVTLASLVQRIARYRDAFYRRLVADVPAPMGERLREEAAKRKQPFAGVRQYLNQTIATERALHLQERRLALLYASMGYPEAARHRASRISAPATRFATEIRLRQTEIGFAIQSHRLNDALRLLTEVEDLLRRGIDCGALIDPWNILGYQGLFPIFPGREDTVRDPRAEDLIHTVGRQFDLYAKAVSESSVNADANLKKQVLAGMRAAADWWDRFATAGVSDLPRVHGGERTDAAKHVAHAMALWKTGGASNPAFWRSHLDGFRTPVAFAQVIDALLTHQDYRASSALLITWLSEAETVPLQDPSASFFRLLFRWMKDVRGEPALSIPERRGLIRRFFELLEANADDRWQVPTLGRLPRGDDEESPDKDNDTGDDSEFSSAYENMTYRDSTDDGVEGSLAESGNAAVPGEFVLDGEAETTEARLNFLTAVAQLRRMVAHTELWTGADSDTHETLRIWMQTAYQQLVELRQLAGTLHAIAIPEPSQGVEGAMEYDRRRVVKGHLLEMVVHTAVQNHAAVRALAALLDQPKELTSGRAADSPTPTWEAEAIRLERAVQTGGREETKRALKSFIALFQNEPLLVNPPSEGGAPIPAIRAHTAIQMVEFLLGRLPRLGLLRQTYQLTKLARTMERNQPPERRRVSSFNQLFRTAVVGVCESLLDSARDWASDTSEDSPLAAMLRKIADAFQTVWVDHSTMLRLSTLEAVLDRSDWEPLRNFMKTYGGDLFTVRFLTLSNLRGILGQGVTTWLDREAQREDAVELPKLVQEWADGRLTGTETHRYFETVLQALVEHYDEYRDYNSTTTQSDYGENLYILLDFLRLKVKYDRIAWRLMPTMLAHEALCRAGFDRLASKWREHIATKTEKLANELLEELTAREAEHAVKLRTIRDRLEERFVQSLRIDQAAVRVARAAAAAAEGQPANNPSFAALQATIQPLADQPSGVGLDVPAWLRRLEEELEQSRATPDTEEEETTPAESDFLGPVVRLSFEEVKQQLEEWDLSLGQ